MADEQTEQDQQPQVKPLSYDPAHLPQPVTTTDFFLRAVLIELRLVRRGLEQQLAQSRQQTRAVEETAKAAKKK